MKQKSPSIGIVVCARERGRVFVSLPYIQAIADHGGLPFLIPFFEDADVSFFHACWKRCDGFLFCGGEDVTPLLSIRCLPAILALRTMNSTAFSSILRLFYSIILTNPYLGSARGCRY